MNIRKLCTLIVLLHSSDVLALELKVEVQGLEKAQQKNVWHFLRIAEESKRKELTADRVRYLHKLAPANIRKALEPYGYFRALIKSDLQEDGQNFIARYQIDRGEPVRFKTVEFHVQGAIQGDSSFNRDFPIKAGDKLDQPVYDAAKARILSDVVEAGYLDARYTKHALRVDLDHYTAVIQLHLDSGPHYHFGSVEFHQNMMDKDFLGRYLQFEQGDLFDQEKLMSLQTRLVDSEYFEHVEVRLARERTVENHVPVDITLTPNKPNRYRFGIGFATDVGPRLSFDWQRRYIGNKGHRMLSELSVSPRYGRLKGEYIIPLQRPFIDSLSYAIGTEYYDNDTRKGNRFVLSATHAIGLANDWRRNLSLEYADEDFELADIPDTSHHLMPGVKWSHLRTDGLSYVRRGHNINYQLIGALDSLLSSSSFLQAHISTKSIFSFSEDWRFISRTELGATMAYSTEDLPVSKRFFAGGDNSIRGFDLDELGPEDGAGRVIGGRFMAVGSLELERRLQGKWSAAVFYDLGNAFDPDRNNKIAHGAGFGLRWQSPVGPVRLDLASALSEEGSPWRMHMVIGPDL